VVIPLAMQHYMHVGAGDGDVARLEPLDEGAWRLRI